MPNRFPKPCIECGKLTTFATRCEACSESRKELMKSLGEKRVYKNKPKAAHYRGDYAKRAKEVRDNAIYCHICKDTARALDPWTADHLIPGDPGSPLLPAHRSCNSRRGNRPLPQ